MNPRTRRIQFRRKCQNFIGIFQTKLKVRNWWKITHFSPKKLFFPFGPSKQYWQPCQGFFCIKADEFLPRYPNDQKSLSILKPISSENISSGDVEASVHKNIGSLFAKMPEKVTRFSKNTFFRKKSPSKVPLDTKNEVLTITIGVGGRLGFDKKCIFSPFLDFELDFCAFSQKISTALPELLSTLPEEYFQEDICCGRPNFFWFLWYLQDEVFSFLVKYFLLECRK